MRTKVRLYLYMISLASIILGFSVASFPEVIQGLGRIISESNVLITDFIAIGGLGATLVNVGLVSLFSILIIDISGAEINGTVLASVSLMFSFSFFGKNIVNIIPILFGTFLYARITKEKYREIVHISLLATSFSPIFNEVLYLGSYPFPLRFLSAFLISASIGFIIKPVARHLMNTHQGFNLYNTGFAVGILATLYVSILKSYGYVPKQRLIIDTGNTQFYSYSLVLFFTILLIWALIQDRNVFKKYRLLIKNSGYQDNDYLINYGWAPTLLNMSINGFLSLFYVLFIAKGELNGPIIGAILTVVGFSGLGKHALNILPIFLGVYLGSLTKSWTPELPSSIFAALFGTALAPIAGHFGFFWGVVASYINSSVALNSGYMHAGMNLYNTGFSVGIVTAVMVPILKKFKKTE